MNITPREIIEFWFADVELNAGSIAKRNAVWFGANADFDEEINVRFGGVFELLQKGELKSWESDIHGILALVILQDQFPRNIFRGTKDAFAFDKGALRLALHAIHDKLDAKLSLLQRVFLYLPLEHAEDLETQDLSVAKYKALAAASPAELRNVFESFVGYAEKHRVIIQQFGRFPHRNKALGRESTEAEVNYLASGGQTF